MSMGRRWMGVTLQPTANPSGRHWQHLLLFNEAICSKQPAEQQLSKPCPEPKWDLVRSAPRGVLCAVPGQQWMKTSQAVVITHRPAKSPLLLIPLGLPARDGPSQRDLWLKSTTHLSHPSVRSAAPTAPCPWHVHVCLPPSPLQGLHLSLHTRLGADNPSMKSSALKRRGKSYKLVDAATKQHCIEFQLSL